MISIKCKECEIEFKVHKYRQSTAKFCSRKCRGTHTYNQMKATSSGLAAIDGSHKRGNKDRKGKTPANAFKKGHQPWNKGLKGVRLNPCTEFKKGSEPSNKMQEGSITIRKDKEGNHRQHVKIGERWFLYSRHIYKEKFGRIKEGHVIHHIDGNTLNDNIGNLKAVTRARHAKIHGARL